VGVAPPGRPPPCRPRGRAIGRLEELSPSPMEPSAPLRRAGRRSATSFTCGVLETKISFRYTYFKSKLLLHLILASQQRLDAESLRVSLYINLMRS